MSDIIELMKESLGYKVYNNLCMNCFYFTKDEDSYMKGKCYLFKKDTGGFFEVESFGSCKKHLRK